MKQFTLEQFGDKTALLPWLIAETVLESRGLHVDDFQPFVDACESRTLVNYNKDRLFRKYMNSKKRREWLYSFVNHWLDGYIKNPDKYLAEIALNGTLND